MAVKRAEATWSKLAKWLEWDGLASQLSRRNPSSKVRCLYNDGKPDVLSNQAMGILKD